MAEVDRSGQELAFGDGRKQTIEYFLNINIYIRYKDGGKQRNFRK